MPMQPRPSSETVRSRSCRCSMGTEASCGPCHSELMDAATQYEEIELTVAEGIATVTLDRPERLNAFTGIMMNELIDACDRIDADPDVRVAVVTGRGRGFCAGADLEVGADTFNYG